ncbi:LPP20 family lipoprotein [Alteromonas sp. AMM-1]|uniref:LPP20 family lipoprotein n=1 Tax=Alteromonas sp. AMM-1 TaxID=3394233 RepID=UPI0039A723EF
MMRKLITAAVLLGCVGMAQAQDSLPGVVTALGFGTIDPAMAKTNAQARMLAKRAAQLDAQRQLSEQVKGIEIRAGSTVEEYEVRSDIIATRVKTWLQGTVVVDEKVYESEGTWVAEVTLGICLTNEAEICKQKESLEAISNAANQN